jgi:hypothetical protein
LTAVTAIDADAWKRFVAHAAAVRARPRFDLDERKYKLGVVDGLRGAVEAARDGGDWLERFFAPILPPFRGLGGHRYDLPLAAQTQWLRAWAAADPVGSAKAVAAFSADERGEARFRRYAELAEAAWSNEAVEENSAAALAIGALLNFAIEPSELPLMRPKLSALLRHLLGLPPDAECSLAERYERELSFARELRGLLESADIPIRDMLDVQVLIFLGAQEQVLWATGASPPPETWDSTGKPYLSICGIYRDEAPYLTEWIEFHRLVGVERFFLYDNESIDDHLEVLAPYLEDGTVVVHEWPSTTGEGRGGDFHHDLRSAFNHCLVEHRQDSRWIAFLDLDEFLFSPTGRPVAELLPAYERWPAVGVNWANFGASGHKTRPSGLLVENYTRRADGPVNRYVKNIVDPRRIERALGAHQVICSDGMTVDENEVPIVGAVTKSVSFERLRLNHYFTKSEDEFEARSEPRRKTKISRLRKARGLQKELDAVEDKTIQSYLPALREAVAAAERRRRASAGRSRRGSPRSRRAGIWGRLARARRTPKGR